ncbi:cyclic GMP-AMP synthase-like receptor 1 [Stomoxys calcitrans]|nr:cyclic GMP-AMP synthase-like receptor 1 [Stomoxys calcitrans]
MESTFDRYLRAIDNHLCCSQANRDFYIPMYKNFKVWFTQEMRRVDRVFDKLCTGVTSFGTYSEWKGDQMQPNEFVMLYILGFPSPVTVSPDKLRPGYVQLNMLSVLEKLTDMDEYEEVYFKLNNFVDPSNANLRRTELQAWISSVIRKALKAAKNVDYDITYESQYNTETFHFLRVRQRAHPNSTIKVDIAPVIPFGEVSWMHKHKFANFQDVLYHTFYAVPISTTKPPRKTRACTFLIINPIAENQLLWSNPTLCCVFRLLISMCHGCKLSQIKNYFLINILLWELKMQKETLWDNSIEDIFKHMLSQLWTYFIDRFLPDFWTKDCNVLNILSQDEITLYEKMLRNICDLFLTYSQRQQLTLDRMRNIFLKSN